MHYGKNCFWQSEFVFNVVGAFTQLLSLHLLSATDQKQSLPALSILQPSLILASPHVLISTQPPPSLAVHFVENN